jgi:hypothetical protein
LATVNSIALSLIQEMEESTDDAGFVAKIEARVNEALDEIAVATNWNVFHTRTTIPTVIAQAQYNLPAGAREIIQLRYLDTGEPIPLMTIQEAARRGIKLEDSGRARAWLEDGNVVSGSDVLYRIRLAPVPDAVVNVECEYYYHPSDVASASVMPVQDQLIVLVKDRVRAYMLEGDQKYDAADRAQRRYEQNLTFLVKREMRKVAQKTVLKQTDLANIQRRRGPILPPDHYSNNW